MNSAVWKQYSASLKATFSGGGASLDPKVVADAGRATSPELARRAYVKWATSFVEELKPHLEKTWARYDVIKKVELVRITLEPIRDAGRIVDHTLQSVPFGKSDKELLSNAEKILLSDAIVTELRKWAKKDVRTDAEHQSPDGKVLAQNLSRLGWLPRLEACFTEAAYEAVRAHTKQFCATEFESPMLDLVLNWTAKIPGPWLRSMLDSSSTADAALRRLEYFAHETFGALRCNEFFDIVTSFPDSIPAVDDLKRCLARTHANRELVSTISESLKRRLLHSGANTNSILLVYVRLIKTMRLLDPRGVLLESVAEPVKQYLRTRQETIRCIVTALTNDEAAGNSDLYDELGLENGANIRPIDFDFDDDNAREADEEAEHDVLTEEATLNNAFSPVAVAQANLYRIGDEPWEPDPIEANPKTSSKARMSNDILGNLVRVYGSKELFVSEYRQLLGERLLTKTPQFNTDAEVRRLELLKLRFGEATMLSCDVMLRDVAESRRVNQHISRDKNIETVVVSRHFWPQFASSAASIPALGGGGTIGAAVGAATDASAHDPPFRLHREVKHAMDEFAVKYAEFKKPRKLVWSPNVGVVDIDLIFPDNTRKAYESLTPLQANIALMFGDRREWHLDELAAQMDLEPEVLRKRLGFWVAEGAIVEDKTTRRYQVAATAPKGDGAGEDDDGDEFMEEEGGVVDMDQAQRELLQSQQEARDKAQMDFISTMLTNLGASPLDAIHRNLQLFAGALVCGYDRNEQELEAFLETYVEAGYLEFVDNKYQMAPGAAQ